MSLKVRLLIFLGCLLISPFARAEADVDFYPKPSDLDVVNGRTATLRCGLIGRAKDNYTIYWQQSLQRIINTERRYQQGTNLYFKKVDVNLDQDGFRCVARNIHTNEERHTEEVQFNINWHHHDGIRLVEPSKDFYVLPGVNVTLRCLITGRPEPRNISWWRNGAEVTKGRQGQLLTLTNLTTAHNGSRFTCCSHLLQKTSCARQYYTLAVRDPLIPAIVNYSSDMIVTSRAPVKLHCDVVSDPPAKINWYKHGSISPLRNKTRDGVDRQLIFPNGTFYKSEARRDQRFECRAHCVKENKYASRYIEVRIASISPFLTEHERIYSKLGDNFEYSCGSPKGVPPPVVRWTHRGIDVERGSKRVSQTDKGVLSITKMTAQDPGLYVCVAENMAGRVTKNISLDLAVAPQVGVLVGRTADEGDNVTFWCPVLAGSPRPTVRWFREGAILARSERKLETRGGNLTVVGVDADDASEYSCEAENMVGDAASNRALLMVNENLKFSPPLMDACVRAGAPSEVVCAVRGSNRSDHLTVLWRRLKDDLVVEERKGDRAVLVLGNGNHDNNQGGGGRYRCEASDGVTRIEGEIDVRAVIPPRITQPPANLTTMEGDNVTLHCASNLPHITPTWYRGEWEYTVESTMTRKDDGVRVGEDGSLTIGGVDMFHDGLYRCVYRVCRFTDAAVALLSVHKEPEEMEGSGKEGVGEEEKTTSTIQTIALSISGSVVYLIITLVIIFYCRKNKKNRKLSEEEKIGAQGAGNGGGGDKLLANGGDTIQMESLMTAFDDRVMSKYYYPPDNIQPISLIGKGEMGSVFLSKAPGIFPDLEDDVLVMVKSLGHDRHAITTGSYGDAAGMAKPHHRGEDEEDMEQQQQRAFNREISLLRRASHDNVVRLLALSHSPHRPPHKPDFLVTEYLDWGILKLCLRASAEGRIGKFTKMQKMEMCYQVACGLEHLKERGLVHRDIAARNCVISSRHVVKVSMLSLSHDGFQQDYYREEEGRVIPVRWMAPESLFSNHFSAKSDVWSFGVTCWEIFTLGEYPYSDLTDQQLIAGLNCDDDNINIRLAPLRSSKRITSLISKCCRYLPSDRPDMRPIKRKLCSILADGAATTTTATTTGGEPSTSGLSEAVQQQRRNHLLTRSDDEDDDEDDIEMV